MCALLCKAWHEYSLWIALQWWLANDDAGLFVIHLQHAPCKMHGSTATLILSLYKMHCTCCDSALEKVDLFKAHGLCQGSHYYVPVDAEEGTTACMRLKSCTLHRAHVFQHMHAAWRMMQNLPNQCSPTPHCNEIRMAHLATPLF